MRIKKSDIRKGKKPISAEPSVVAAFWRDMGLPISYMRGLKRFATINPGPYRALLMELLKASPRLEKVPRGFIEISEAERAWGQSMLDFAVEKWRAHKRQNSRFVQLVILRGKPTVLLGEGLLFSTFRAPKWTSVDKVMEATGRPYHTIYSRLRYSSVRRKIVRRWFGSYYVVYNAQDVEAEMQIWRTHGRCSNTVNSGRMLSEYDEHDEVARAQWRPMGVIV